MLQTKRKNAVSYFCHFRNDFLKTYGIANDDKAFSTNSFTRRLDTINCKYIVKHQIAISVLADTFCKNVKYLQVNQDILDKTSLTAFIRKIEKIKEPRDVLNNSIPNSQQKAGIFKLNLFMEPVIKSGCLFEFVCVSKSFKLACAVDLKLAFTD